MTINGVYSFLLQSLLFFLIRVIVETESESGFVFETVASNLIRPDENSSYKVCQNFHEARSNAFFKILLCLCCKCTADLDRALVVGLIALGEQWFMVLN